MCKFIEKTDEQPAQTDAFITNLIAQLNHLVSILISLNCDGEQLGETMSYDDRAIQKDELKTIGT